MGGVSGVGQTNNESRPWNIDREAVRAGITKMPDPASRKTGTAAGTTAQIDLSPVSSEQLLRVDHRSLCQQASVSYLLGQYEAAKEAYDAAETAALEALRKTNPQKTTEDKERHCGAMATLSTVAMRKGMFDVAEYFSLERVKYDPENMEAISMLADAQAQQGKLGEAMDTIWTVIGEDYKKGSLSPDQIGLAAAYSGLLYELGGAENYQKSLEAAKELISQLDSADKKGRIPAEMYNNIKADLLMLAGEHKAAIAHYERALELSPANPNVLMSLGKAYLQTSDYKNTEIILNKLNEIAPGSKVTCGLVLGYLINRTYLGTDTLPEQVLNEYTGQLYDRLKKAEGLFSDDPQVLNDISSILVSRERYQEAAVYFDKIVQGVESFPDTANPVRDGAIFSSLRNRLYCSVLDGERAEIDGAAVDFVQLAEFGPEPGQAAMPAGKELQVLTGEHSAQYVFDDRDNFIKVLNDASGTDVSMLSARQAVEYAAEITGLFMDYKDDTAKADLPHISIEEKMIQGAGVCRNYSVMFKAVFDAIRSVNKNLANTYCGTMSNSTHEWNIIYQAGSGGITAVNVDATWNDSDEGSGGRLDAYDAGHYNAFKAANSPEDIEKFLNTHHGNGWSDPAMIALSDSYYQNGEYLKAAECARTFLADYPDHKGRALMMAREAFSYLHMGKIKEAGEEIISASETAGEQGKQVLEAAVSEINIALISGSIPAEKQVEAVNLSEDLTRRINSDIKDVPGLDESFNKTQEFEEKLDRKLREIEGAVQNKTSKESI